MKVKFILVAQGGLSLHNIQHIVWAGSAERAIQDCESVVATLSKVGYFQFYLYDVDPEQHVQIASFTVSAAEPVVTVKDKRSIVRSVATAV